MIIGRFTYIEDERSYEGRYHFRGNILTSCLVFDNVRLLPMRGRVETDPDYQVLAEVFGADVEVGSGWRRTDTRGRTCVEIMLDDPGLQAPLKAMLVPSSGDGVSFEARWTRLKPKEADAV